MVSQSLPYLEETYYIYALCDPGTTVVRYIGQTCNLRGRYSGHLSGDGGNPLRAKTQWIFGLLDQGLRPNLVVLEECCGSEIDMTERKYIVDYRNRGIPLFNTKALRSKTAEWLTSETLSFLDVCPLENIAELLNSPVELINTAVNFSGVRSFLDPRTKQKWLYLHQWDRFLMYGVNAGYFKEPVTHVA